MDLQPALTLPPVTHVLPALDSIMYWENFNWSHTQVKFEKSSYAFEVIRLYHCEIAVRYRLTPGSDNPHSIVIFHPSLACPHSIWTVQNPLTCCVIVL